MIVGLMIGLSVLIAAGVLLSISPLPREKRVYGRPRRFERQLDAPPTGLLGLQRSDGL
jgi:hypothetical protein